MWRKSNESIRDDFISVHKQAIISSVHFQPRILWQFQADSSEKDKQFSSDQWFKK